VAGVGIFVLAEITTARAWEQQRIGSPPRFRSSGITNCYYAHRAPLAFKPMMTLPQPPAFSVHKKDSMASVRVAGGESPTPDRSGRCDRSTMVGNCVFGAWQQGAQLTPATQRRNHGMSFSGRSLSASARTASECRFAGDHAPRNDAAAAGPRPLDRLRSEPESIPGPSGFLHRKSSNAICTETASFRRRDTGSARLWSLLATIRIGGFNERSKIRHSISESGPEASCSSLRADRRRR
jgi:hypothetical protein